MLINVFFKYFKLAKILAQHYLYIYNYILVIFLLYSFRYSIQMTISEETINLKKLAAVKIKDKLQLAKTFNVGVRSVYRILNGFITSNVISKRMKKQ